MRKEWSRAKTNKSSKMKTFIIFFCFTMVLATTGFTFAGSAIKNVLNAPILGTKPQANLMDEMTPLVDPDSPFYEAFKDKKRINLLMVGLNQGLTDTIMVASFDTEQKHVDLISIPRDTYYERKGFNSEAERKINAAYRKDIKNTAYAVSDVLEGMPIHCYAVVEYKGVATIVDAMGGVPMNIPKPMRYKDPTDKPPLIIDIPAGQQVLDGEHSVQFLRYRSGYAEGDIGRVKAQQEFMKSAFRQMLSFDLPKIARTIAKNVESDVTVSMAARIASKAVGMKSDSIETYIMPYTEQGRAPWYVYPKRKEIREMITKIYSIEGEDDNGEGAEG
ncbi:MAG: LCP family protein [Anaerovoracaceae bacterium]|jgi:LCP family protein required for cell wall assembly